MSKRKLEKRIEVCRGLRGEIAETTEACSAGLSEAAVIAEVVVTGKEGDTPGESRLVERQKRANPIWTWSWKEVLGHPATRVCGPTSRPRLHNGMGDFSSGRSQWSQGKVGGRRSIYGRAELAEGVGTFVFRNACV